MHRRIPSCLLLPTVLAIALGSAPARAGECVVLLHGLVRTSKSMDKMRHALESDSYRVLNVDYPSRTRVIEELAETVVAGALDSLGPDSCSSIHFVTHSLGGILVRQYLARHEVVHLGKVVMLGPPNQGSEVVDHLRGWGWANAINGPSFVQLGTDSASVPNVLPPVDYPVGVIAGDRSINWINSLMIPGPDDGKVSVTSAKLEGMRDFLVLHATHPMIMKNDEAIRQVRTFLKSGKFAHPSE